MNQAVIKAICLTLLAAALAGCQPKMMDLSFQYELHFQVVDSLSRDPITDATVQVSDGKKEIVRLTDEQGWVHVGKPYRWLVNADAPGDKRRPPLPDAFDLNVVAPGYENKLDRFQRIEFVHQGQTQSGAARYELTEIVLMDREGAVVKPKKKEPEVPAQSTAMPNQKEEGSEGAPAVVEEISAQDILEESPSGKPETTEELPPPPLTSTPDERN
jgi:hypothetical protein